jgi:hypothetical protein
MEPTLKLSSKRSFDVNFLSNSGILNFKINGIKYQSFSFYRVAKNISESLKNVVSTGTTI